MRSKLLLLFLYFAYLFVFCRILDTASWYYDSSTNAELNSTKLSVKELKLLLGNRGVNYYDVVEKHELRELVRYSGKVSREELIEAMSPSNVPTDSTNFASVSHFDEEIENTMDSAWLVQVVVNDLDTALLPEKSWQDIKLRTSKFGIRNGVIKCFKDRRLCHRKSWTTSRLILVLPRGKRPVKGVSLYNHLLPSTSAAILHWLQKHLSSKVRKIQTDKELEQWMIYGENARKSEIRIIFFSFLKSCPIFLSTLAVKFDGKVKFATVDLTTVSYKKYVNSEDLPSYIVITAEKKFSYGVRRGECYNFKSMKLYLKTFFPEMNDIFDWSILLINALAAFELFYMYSDFWKHFSLYVQCLFLYNFQLIMLWLSVLKLDQLPVMMIFTEMGLKGLSFMSESNVAAILRNDYKSYYSNTFLFCTYGFFVIMSGYLFKKFKWLQLAE